MPLYVYVCGASGCPTGEVEKRHSMAELADVHRCPTCGEPMERTLTTPAVAKIAVGGTPRHHHWVK